MAAGAIKLQLSDLGIYGRASKISILQECYRRVEGSEGEDDGTGDGAESELIVLVSGGAGTGKSTLIIRGLAEVIISKKGDEEKLFFVSGKFDYQREATGQPYAAICSAFDALVIRMMSTHHETDRKRMGQEIRISVGPGGLEVLETVVPGIQRLFSVKDDEESVGVVVIANADGLNLLKFAVRSFL
jgi:predicted ATPase